MSNRLLIGACVASLWACGDGANAEVVSGSGAVTGGSAGAAAKSDECPDSYQGFSVGPSGALVTDAKSGIAVRVLDGSVPPEFGYNTWKIAILDATTMAPVPNARLTWQCAYMDVHGHGSNPKSLENLGNGEYRIVDLNLRMFGPWEVRFWIDPTGQAPEYIPTTSIAAGMACVPTIGPMGAPNIEFKVCVPKSSD